jgi:capsular exopolysaccharide synthesis family protein
MDSQDIVPVRDDHSSFISRAHTRTYGRRGGNHFSSEPPSLLLELLRIVRNRRKAVLALAALGAICGLLSTVPQASRFRARTSLDIQGLNENFMNMRAVDPRGQAGNISAESYLQTHIKILQSEAMIKRAMDKIRSAGEQKIALRPDLFSQWRLFLRLPSPEHDSYDQHLHDIARNLKVRPMGITRLVEINCESFSARLAADFCNTLATEFIAQDLEVRWETAETTGDWLSRQLADVRKKLEASEQKLQAYAKDHNLLFSPERETVGQEKLRQLQAELSRAQADRVAKQSIYELSRSENPESLPPVLDSGPLKEYQMKLTDLRRQHADLTAAFTADYPRVQRMDAQIKALERSMLTERANVLARLQNEYNAARQREALLASAYAAQERLVSELSLKSTHYNMLQREVESGRQLYETMLLRVREAGFASAMRASPIRVVDAAAVPAVPFAPNRIAGVAVGLVFGCVFGVAIALLRERTDRHLRNPGDASVHLNAHELGVIPSAVVGAREYLQSRGKLRSIGGGADPSLRQLLAGSREDRLAMVAWFDKSSMMAESFRTVMNSVLLAGRQIRRTGVILLSSPNVGEGKTTLVSNLGIALAETNRRVLLIDADMRRPRLHKIFNLEEGPGLQTALHHETKITDRLLDELVRPTFIPGLFVLRSEEVASDISRLLHSPNLGTLLDRLGKAFDSVLVDSPPMMHISDARVLGQYADGAVLVLRAGVATRDTAALAQEMFLVDGTPILGIILNDFNPNASGSARYYQPYHRYYSHAQGA